MIKILLSLNVVCIILLLQWLIKEIYGNEVLLNSALSFHFLKTCVLKFTQDVFFNVHNNMCTYNDVCALFNRIEIPIQDV